ncbi:MAG: hypothetical protein KC505_01175 [Myxococcales bacterium]|nr:hypothetical protein [Myxococcales bacterium]
MILQKTQTGHNSLACYRNYVAAVEDLVGEKEYYKSQSFGSVQIQFSNPVSESFKHKANQKIRAQEKIFKKQKWRKKVKIELEKLISSGNYKCEINSCFEKIIDLLLDPHYGYQDYKNDFKDALEYQKFLEITFHNYFC